MSLPNVQKSSKKYAKVEFKRYEPSKDALETFVARVPAGQARLVNFFQMIKPLIEGCNFNHLPFKVVLKLELDPRQLQRLCITEY